MSDGFVDVSEQSKLTVQKAWVRVMLEAPDGPGRSRHVSLEDLQRFVDRAKSEVLVMCEGDMDRYRKWIANRNVALMDSKLYTDTPWGQKR